MLDIIKAIVFGIVEGVTEWLPISSTGHMIILEEFLQFDEVSPGFWEMFLVVIQLGAIMAVVVLFWQKIFPFQKRREDINTRHCERMSKNFVFTLREAIQKRILAMTKVDVLTLWLKILVACIPAAVIGILFDDFFESLFYNSLSVSLALIVFGIGFIVIETKNKNRTPRITELAGITFRTAIIIGLFQLIAAIFPGTSRSGATILGALMLGVSRTVAAEFTFFLAIPVMFGASLLKLLRFGFSFSGLEAAILFTGMLSAFLVSVFVIRFLLGYIKTNDFKIFGYYRIALGIFVIIYFSFL